MDMRAFHTSIESVLDEAGMDIVRSNYDKDSGCPSDIYAVNPITKEKVHFIVMYENVDNGL